MAVEKTTKRSWGDSEEATEPNAAHPSARRILIPAACGCAGIGCLLVLGSWRGPFLTGDARPGDATPGDATPAAARALGPSAPSIKVRDVARPTPEQLVAEAKQLAKRLLTTLPDNPQALVLAGRVYYAFNDVTRADDCWQTCLQRHPEFAEARCAVAEAAWEHGDFEQAAQQLNAVFAANPQLDQKQVFFLADALMNVGRSPEAVTVLERSAKHRSLPPFGLFLLGHAYAESGEYEKARQQFVAVLATDRQSANAHFGLATVYTQLGELEKAGEHRAQYAEQRKDELAESARLRPEMRKADWADPIPVVREAYLNAGKVFAGLNKLDETEAFWLRAAELDPASPRPRQLLALLHADQSREAEARMRNGE